MTQICHMLRTNCDMDFGEITEVCPWDILAHDCRQDLDADQVASPRVLSLVAHLRLGDSLALGEARAHLHNVLGHRSPRYCGRSPSMLPT